MRAQNYIWMYLILKVKQILHILFEEDFIAVFTLLPDLTALNENDGEIQNTTTLKLRKI